LPSRRYARFMMYPALLTVVLLTSFVQPQVLATERIPTVPAEDYALYDQVIANKFLTSDTRLVVLERLTIARLLPNQQQPTTVEFFQEREFFEDRLPAELVREFVGVNREPSRLEGRFQFGIPVRFISGDENESEAMSGLPVSVDSAKLIEAPPVLDHLAFSRVGRTRRNDQALLYVENPRPDGSGAGFLVWLVRQEQEWIIAETDVVWTSHDDAGTVEGP